MKWTKKDVIKAFSEALDSGQQQGTLDRLLGGFRNRLGMGGGNGKGEAIPLTPRQPQQ